MNVDNWQTLRILDYKPSQRDSGNQVIVLPAKKNRVPDLLRAEILHACWPVIYHSELGKTVSFAERRSFFPPKVLEMVKGRRHSQFRKTRFDILDQVRSQLKEKMPILESECRHSFTGNINRGSMSKFERSIDVQLQQLFDLLSTGQVSEDQWHLWAEQRSVTDNLSIKPLELPPNTTGSLLPLEIPTASQIHAV